jgi:hypothetical protein
LENPLSQIQKLCEIFTQLISPLLLCVTRLELSFQKRFFERVLPFRAKRNGSLGSGRALLAPPEIE